MKRRCFEVALLLLFSFAAGGQVTGRLTGTVVDASGAGVPGARVNLFLPGGKTPVLAATATEEGLFRLIGVRAGRYDLTVEAAGFVSYKLEGVEVDPARETTLPAIKLELAAVRETVTVSASAQTLQTGNAEISATVTNEQVRRLPLLDRDPLSLILTRAGVSTNARSYTIINGQRTSYANVTLDGINIQDNFIRDNALDYSPNMLLLDQVSEFTVATSNTNATVGGGSAQVAFVTPSGGNEFHGSAYWYNRNNVAAANDWFSNRDGVERPFLNQNQAGGSLGGPIVKDRLLFYANYEAYRQRQQMPVNSVILTADARQGIFTYRDTRGAVSKVNVLEAAGVRADPVMERILAQVPGPERINNFDVGDSSSELPRDTAGYRFNKRDNRTRDNVTGRIDYNASTRHLFSFTYLWNRDNVDRPDADESFSVVPKVTNPNHAQLASAAWRWNPAPQWTNELRGGYNLAPGEFRSSEKFGDYIIDGMIFNNPVNTFRRQGRATNTYNLANNASYLRGKHQVLFGFQTQAIRVEPVDEWGITPTYSLGIGTGNEGLSGGELPSVRRSDLDAANELLATLAGYITAYSQSFNVTSRTSGFVSGAPYLRHYGLNEYALYAQDNWKLGPRLTLTLGLRYTLYGIADERDSLALLPVLRNDDPVATLLSNSTLDFAGSSAGRPWYRRDRNNVAPNIGLAWDPFGNGKTAVRAGYMISYVNDQSLLASLDSADLNEGLWATSERAGLSGRISTGLPRVVAPAFKVPRTFKDNYQINPMSAFGLMDPRLRAPYVQQWTFGIQQDLKAAILEVRYVGNHAVKGYRAFDYNQVVIKENGFLEDFQRALNNGNLAREATGVFDPRYDTRVPGSQPLTVFPKLEAGGLLTNATIRGLIERGEAGQLAATYQMNQLNGSVDFFHNRYALGTDYLTNYTNSTYNALQVELRRRARAGLDFEANYTYSKVLSDSAGTSQSRLEHFLDLGNPKLERARADFDLTHAIKGSVVWDLPAGKGHRLNRRRIGPVLEGWAVSGILTWQSGTPFSILSGRGTLNRTGGGRSDNNTANTTLNKSQLDELLRFRMTGEGPFFVAASAKGADGRAVAADGAPPFSGQVFFHPGPGTVGGLQRRMFSGPWTFNLDFGVLKRTGIREKQSAEFRMEAVNIFNHPTFVAYDQWISSVNFGRISYTYFWPRVIQFGLYYRF